VEPLVSLLYYYITTDAAITKPIYYYANEPTTDTHKELLSRPPAVPWRTDRTVTFNLAEPSCAAPIPSPWAFTVCQE
jgi:hypothetical protein